MSYGQAAMHLRAVRGVQAEMLADAALAAAVGGFGGKAAGDALDERTKALSGD